MVDILSNQAIKFPDLIVSIRWDQSNVFPMRFQGIRNIDFYASYQILFASMQRGIVSSRAMLHSLACNFIYCSSTAYLLFAQP
jgi:hypothetical protein